MDQRRIADYFIISGVPDRIEERTETKPLINAVLPITDVTVIIKSLNEQCPIGYTCIDYTPGGHIADLNNGNFKSPVMHVCYRRGNDKPPLLEVGVYHEGKDRLLPDVEIVQKTPYGRCASTGGGIQSGTYLNFKRAKTRTPYNQLVVVDLCIIFNDKKEHPPHAFYSIRKNLNNSYYGMIGSEVFLCYKKTFLTPPSIYYTPQVISRFPLQDYATFPLPETVPIFCLPTGARIELRPTNISVPRPVASTFVLTSNSSRKVYGTAVSFYEPLDKALLSDELRMRLGLKIEDDNNKADGGSTEQETFTVKSICILSRWPFFECFEKFLTFLHNLVFSAVKDNVSLEHLISHFILDARFPTSQRSSIILQLLPGTDENITIYQPSSRLPLTGASFFNLLTFLGVENTMTVLLFGLCEQKILLHSLNPWILTGVSEAISAMLFPFQWQCPYVPLCPLSLHGILNAPLPFIVGIDSRCFDQFTPPEDVICIDLDTRSILLTELKNCLNTRMLPKFAARTLRNSLDEIFKDCQRVKEPSRQMRIKLDLEIREAFVRFMATILRGFRSYLLPIIKAPTVGATDPTSLFDFEGFLLSRDRSHNPFYQLITKTQMFTHYIEERSFVSDEDTSLAFFDDYEERLNSGELLKLCDNDDGVVSADRSVYIPAPEQSLCNDKPETNKDLKFGPLDPAKFHRHPELDSSPSTENAPDTSYSVTRRTKQEVEASQRMAEKSIHIPLEWFKYLMSCCFSLWFSTLPSYIAYCNNLDSSQETRTSNILKYAYSTIIRMQKLKLSIDEICFRTLILLCGHQGQPVLAVKVFFAMRKAGIRPNAITYGYYNKALLENPWPRGEDELNESSNTDSSDRNDTSEQNGLDNQSEEPEITAMKQYRKLYVDVDRQYNSSCREGLTRHLAENERVASDKLALVITMATCSRCDKCQSLLFDEEIVDRWSHNESNLNTVCLYCRAKIVPTMSIHVEDRRFDNTNMDITVPYLSPIVLRKEFESVCESSGDDCLSSSRFVDHHPIVFWNLLWYFSRINIPTHLAFLCLESSSILKDKDIPHETRSLDQVIVKTLWDNDKLLPDQYSESATLTRLSWLTP